MALKRRSRLIKAGLSLRGVGVAATAEEGLPFGGQALEAFVEGEAEHFPRGEPLQGMAFFADPAFGVFRSDEDEADVEMEMRRLLALLILGNGMDIEVERFAGGEDEAVDAGFLGRFPAGDADDVFVAVAVAAKLEPAIEIAMVMEEGAAAIRADDEGAAGEMAGKAGAEEAIFAAVEELDHAVSKGELGG